MRKWRGQKYIKIEHIEKKTKTEVLYSIFAYDSYLGKKYFSCGCYFLAVKNFNIILDDSQSRRAKTL
jgi:hypothetical protein